MCFTPHETFLQILIHKKEQNKKKSFFSCFVTSTLSSNYKLACKRASFTLQKGVFYITKGRLLHYKRASFTLQKGVFYTSKGHLLLCKRAPFRTQKTPFQKPIRNLFNKEDPLSYKKARILQTRNDYTLYKKRLNH